MLLRKNTRDSILLLGLTVMLLCLLWPSAFTLADKGRIPGKSPGAEKANTAELGGSDRYLTHISTDKPFYRPGEKVYARGVLLQADTRVPLREQTNGVIEIRGPKGDVIVSEWLNSADSVWSFAWEVPAEMPGGEYTLHVTYPTSGYAPAERKFDIRAYRAPRLRSQITFLREGYGPGDKVSATLHTERAEGGIPVDAPVTVTANVDGQPLGGATAKVDASGNCTVSLELPRSIEKGEGTLALAIADGGVVEVASKTIPILLQSVDVQFYPEGGDLVQGLPNRVYFEARTPAQKPADIAGVVLDAAGKEVAHFRSEHEGRGRFELTPADGAYALRIDEPAGIKKTIPLPAAKASGAVLRVLDPIVTPGGPLRIAWACAGVDDVKLVIAQHETELTSSLHTYSKERSLKDGAPLAWTNVEALKAEGVLRVTLYDAKTDQPLAERLAFRQPAKALKIEVNSDKRAYVPGDTVKLTVKTTDADGKAVSGFVGLTVTDDSVLEMVDKREQAPRFPVSVLLEPEVKELADAQIYFDAANPKAPQALDLLLGTQGWRRFAFADAEKFLAEHGDDARRVLALRLQVQEELKKAQGFGGRADGAPVNEVAAQRAADRARPRSAAVAPAHAMPDAAAPVPAVAAVPPPMRQNIARPPLAGNKEVAQQKDAQLEQKEKLEAAIEKSRDRMDRKAVAAKRRANDEEDMPVQRARRMLRWQREYAHQVRPNRKPTDRVDFSETLYWNAALRTDARTGEATISFGLSDSVTTFRVFADGFGADGALGSASAKVESLAPFYVEPKLPLEVTAGDTILLPVGVINGIGSDFGGATVSATLKGDFKLGELKPFELPALGRVREILPIKVGVNNGASEFTLNAEAGPYSDKVTRTLTVKPRGFPIEVPFGGMLGADKSVVHKLTILDSVAPRSLITNIAVYPTPLANMNEALRRLIQDPNGCFEQTSSTSYPLTMAQQYFLSHTGVDPKMVELARTKLDAGYKRLVGFWCPDRGYEWFGQDPGHEALTAFGLLHFTDMAQVRDVDANMINTTRTWLLKQRDGKGGFERKRRALHTWIEDKDCSNAYILWALLETGAKDLEKEVAAAKTAAEQSSNSYVVALTANSLFLTGDKDGAQKLMQRLAAKQDAKAGEVSGGAASIVGSGGQTLAIETTALATLAWLRDPAFAGNVENAIKYLAESCQGGRYGSTQSTVLALRAIVQYDKQRARPKAPGKVRVFVDGQSVGGPVSFEPTTEGAIKLPDLSELLTRGEHAIELKMEGGGEMPYAIAVNYNTLTPASSKECKVDLQVKLAQEEVSEGTATEAMVTVTNKTGELIPTPVAIVGIPGGLEPRHEQLKELVKKGTIDAYEVIGREVVLYWRGMKANDKVEIPISLIAAIPGTYTAPASRAYLYYTDEFKQWVDGVKVNITPEAN